jgi:hypothetical protein
VVRVFLEGLFGAEGSQPLLLTAPTGKARVRLETKTQRPASTIHQVHHAAGMLGADYRLLRKPTKSTMKYSMGIDVSDRCFSSVNLAMLVFFSRARVDQRSRRRAWFCLRAAFFRSTGGALGGPSISKTNSPPRVSCRGASVVEPIRVISLEMSDIDESAVDFDVVAAGKGYPPGFVRLPTWIGEEFCRQLTAEPFNAEKAAWSQVARPE